MRQFYRAFISTKISLFLLALLAIVMLVGTIVPQLPLGGSEEDYIASWGFGKFARLYAWGLMDIFHTPWFLFLGFVTFLQLLLCTIDGFTTLRRRAVASPDILRMGARRVLDVTDDSTQRLCDVLAGRGFRTTSFSEGGSDIVVAQRGLPSRLVSILYHLALFLFVIGFVLTARYVQMGDFYLYPGERRSLPKGQFARGTAEGDSFELELKEFITEQTWFNESYFPRDWKSSLVVYEGGEEKTRETIEVNTPLRYAGITVYQYDFRQDFKLQVSVDDTMESGQGAGALQAGATPVPSVVSGSAYEKFRVPGRIEEFMVRTIYVGTLFDKGDEPEPIVPNTTLYVYKEDAPMGREKLGTLVQDEPLSALGLTFTLTEVREASGLNWRRDPGIPLLWFAFITFMLGMGVRVFLPSYKLTFLHDREAKKVYVGGKVSGLAAYLDEEIGRIAGTLS
jgi:cytochrome c biogenesis protein ResB